MVDNLQPPSQDGVENPVLPPTSPDVPPVNRDEPDTEDAPSVAEDLGPRLERLGGEPAPDITPEEFARLQQAGQIHIDPRGRVRTAQRSETDAGISLRKRRAWYV